MYALILTIFFGGSTSSVSVPGFQSIELCETASDVHIAKIMTGSRWGMTKKILAASCVKTSEK